MQGPERKRRCAGRPAHRRCCRVKTKSADKPGSVTAHNEVRYGRHSSRRRVAAALKPPTRGLDEQPVLPNARPLTWCCSGWRLPRFTRFRLTGSDSSLWPCSALSSAALAATYGVRALPGILLYGARTFLSPRGLRHDGQRRSGWLRTPNSTRFGIRGQSRGTWGQSANVGTVRAVGSPRGRVTALKPNCSFIRLAAALRATARASTVARLRQSASAAFRRRAAARPCPHRTDTRPGPSTAPARA